MHEPSFSKLFRTENPNRDNLLARVFGMLSEEPVRIWCRSSISPYVDLGRPTIKRLGEGRGSTVDFALRSRTTGKTYVAELKCELAFANYGYLVLTSSDQVKRHVKEGKEAFLRFVDCARNSHTYAVYVRGKQVETSGSILVWGSLSDAGRMSALAEFGFADVLSVEEIIRDLLRTDNEEYRQFVDERRRWCEELFDGLLGRDAGHHSTPP